MATENPKVTTDETTNPTLASDRHTMAKRRRLRGVVVSDKMDKTIVVKVDRQVKHPFYHKYIVRSRHFKAHDEKNDAKIGDLVSVVEGPPRSKHKRWNLVKVIRRSGLN